MPTPWHRRLGRIAVTIAVVAVLALLWIGVLLLPLPSDSLPVIAFAVIAAPALLWGVWWLWWRLPQRQVARLALKIRDPKARADTEDNFRKTVGQALGGAAVLIGAGLAYVQFTQQQKTQQQSAEISRQASRDLLISNQVSKGFEQLAGATIPMRLGGIYALEGVMNTSEQYRLPVFEALCAYVRDGTRNPKGEDPPATDVQAALTVIGRGPRPAANLSQAKIPHANLVNANLSSADLTGADLSSARLDGASLFGAVLSSADLNGADLTGADLHGADLTGTDLHGANLTGANLTLANLRDVKLDGRAQLDQACGTEAKLPSLPPGLTLRPCPPNWRYTRRAP
jgi:uncharacterized protein YjbI with pentapeptide repeats